MNKMTEIYDVTEDLFYIGRQLRRKNIQLRRADIARLLWYYIIEEICVDNKHNNNYTPFTDLADKMFEYQEVINIVRVIFRNRLTNLYDQIINELKIDPNSFVTGEIKAHGAIVMLIVQNEGDYRIIHYELHKEGLL